MPIEVQVALVTGVCGLLAAVVAAVAQIMQNRKQRKNAEAKEAQQALEEANKKIAEQERQRRDDALQRQINAIENTGTQTQKDIKMLASQVEKMRSHVNMRASESEEGIRMITSILSKDARTRSNLIHMYARTEAQLKTLMEIETYNLRFTKDTAATLATVGELLAKLLDSNDDVQRLRHSLDENNEMQQEFIDGVINAQRQFMAQGNTDGTDESVEKEIERINNIMKHKPDEPI